MQAFHEVPDLAVGTGECRLVGIQEVGDDRPDADRVERAVAAQARVSASTHAPPAAPWPGAVLQDVVNPELDAPLGRRSRRTEMRQAINAMTS